MDFATLKRKDLQKLAKKHGLRANAKVIDISDVLIFPPFVVTFYYIYCHHTQ